MARRRQNLPNEDKGLSKLASLGSRNIGLPSYVPEYSVSQKFDFGNKPDSLQKFQWELQSSFNFQRQLAMREQKKNKQQKKGRRRTNTQYKDESEEEQEIDLPKTSQKIRQLRSQIKDIKSQLLNANKNNGIEDRLDRLLQEMAKNKSMDNSYFSNKLPSSSIQQPNNIFYPMMYPGYPPPYMPQNSYDKASETFPRKRGKDKLRRDLRKYFFVAAFTIFLRSQAKKLSSIRKTNFRKFYLQKFDSQILSLKNWIVDGNAYAIPVILEKKDINFQFWNENKQVVKRQKQNLILKLVLLGIDKLKKDCTPQRLSPFIELIYNLCRRGSFVMSRFWTANQIQKLHISEFYGNLRLDDSLQKFLIGLVVFMKVLVFNMFLQPHKFDNVNFPKRRQTLKNNMYIISSVYYRITKQILEEYLSKKRISYYKPGNWLDVKEQFIVECCEPLIYNCEYPEQAEYISVMLQIEHMQQMRQHLDWQNIKKRIEQIIEIIHKEMKNKGRNILKNLKYKLYN